MARPRTFDPDKALEDTMNLFWARGYDGTSLQDIEIATGLNKQSLYRAFGDKRSMYLKALGLYETREVSQAAGMLRRPGTVHERLDRMFVHAIEKVTVHGDRRGCFLCNAGVDQAGGNAATQSAVNAMMGRVQAAIEEVLVDEPRYAADAESRKRTAVALMAGYFGLRSLVRAGLPPATLDAAKANILAMV